MKQRIKECDCNKKAYWILKGLVDIGLHKTMEMEKYECSGCHRIVYGDLE